MPVPCCCFKSKVVGLRKMKVNVTEKADQKKRSSDNNMKAMESCGHKKCCPINCVGNRKGGLKIL